jgi:D-sedoheptulose 7-phosphate isomerase
MSPVSNQQVNAVFSESAAAIDQARCLSGTVARACEALVTCLGRDGRILICGNGGSAADSLHFSGELLNKFLRVRRPLPAISLAADTSALTSIGNDESFDHVFSKQVEALGQAGDVLVAISTSGNSANILAAIDAAQQREMRVVTLNGRDGGAISGRLGEQDIDIVVPGEKTARIQEVHGIIIHAFCEFIDQQLFGDSAT